VAEELVGPAPVLALVLGMLASRLPPMSTNAPLNGTPFASEGIAARPPLRK